MSFGNEKIKGEEVMKEIISDLEKKAVDEMYEINKEFFTFGKEDRNSSSDIFLLLEKSLKDVQTIEDLEKIDFPKEYLHKLNLVESMLDEL